MMDPGTALTIAAAARFLIPKELLKEIYGDLLKPGVSQVGKAIGTLIGLGNTILWPLLLLNESARIAIDKNLENIGCS